MRVWLWIIVGCLIGLQPCAAQGQGNNMQTQINKLLRSIVPIETTAEDVKKLLGEPVSNSPDFHEFDEFNVLVSYTTGLPCEKEPEGWNAPRDRVITFTIIVKAVFHQKDLKNLGIDLSKYEKDIDKSSHVPETIYTNDEKGISLYINGDQVTSISLFSAKKYLHLICPKKSEIQTIAYCEMLRHPNLYVGKEVRFRALYTSVFETSAFSCSDCKGDEYMAWVEFDDSSVKSSTKPEIHKKFREMMTRYIDDVWVIFNTEMLVTGVLDNSKAGYGHLGMYRFLVTVKSIEEMGETKKIDLEKR